MANWTTLKAAIASVIKTNGNQEITGQLLQNTLNNIVNAVGANAAFVGIASPTTNPGMPDGPVFYIAYQIGYYVSFDNYYVGVGDIGVFRYNNGAWAKTSIRYDVNDINVSKLFPKNGTGGTDKYTLLNAINLIPTHIRYKGIKCTFTDDLGSVQTYTYNGGTWASANSWDKLVIKKELTKEINDLNTKLTQSISTTKNELTQNIDTAKSQLTQSISTTKNELTQNIDTAKSQLTQSISTTKNELTQNIGTTKSQLTQSIEEVSTKTNRIHRLATFGNSVNIKAAGEVGQLIKAPTPGIAGTTCTNLISINSAVFKISLQGLYDSRYSRLPAYVVVDKDLKILQAVYDVKEATIKYSELPTGSRYIIANSWQTGGADIVTLDYSNSSGFQIGSLDSGIALPVAYDLVRLKTSLAVSRDITPENRNNFAIDKQAVLPNEVILVSSIVELPEGGILKKLNAPKSNIDTGGTPYKVRIQTQTAEDTFETYDEHTIPADSIGKDFNINLPEGIIKILLIAEVNQNARTQLLNDANDCFFTIEEKYFVPNVSERVQLLGAQVDELKNLHRNKHVVIFGDSLSCYQPNAAKSTSWIEHFGRNFEFASVKSYAKHGATLAASANTVYDITENPEASNNCLFNQVNKLADEIEKKQQELPDYVFVALGFNDSVSSVDSQGAESSIVSELGKDYSKTVNINTCITIIKALRHFHDRMWNINKNAQIIILTPTQKKGNFEHQEKIATQIRKCAEYLAWPVIDQFKNSTISAINESLAEHSNQESACYSQDGLSYTPEYAKKIGNWIAKQTKSLLL